MEEVMLHNRHSHLVHQRLGEIRYTMGGAENIEIAKTYYLHAYKLNPKNLRVLYGLYLVSLLHASRCSLFNVPLRPLASATNTLRSPRLHPASVRRPKLWPITFSSRSTTYRPRRMANTLTPWNRLSVASILSQPNTKYSPCHLRPDQTTGLFFFWSR